MILLQLMFEFFKIGLFAVGGGQATIPFLYDLAHRFDWFTTSQLADMIAISESTPGPIGVNMATYVGFQTYGIVGGVFATLALVFPCVVIIMVISKALDSFKDNPIIENVFKIIRPCVVGLIASAALTVFSIAVLDLDAFMADGNLLSLIKGAESILFIGLFILTMKWKKHPIVYLGIAMVFGIVLGL